MREVWQWVRARSTGAGPFPLATGSAQRSANVSLEAVAAGLLVAAGMLLRARGVLFGGVLEMWNDEASWAIHIFERPLSENVIRPPAFIILSKLSAMAFRYREFGFRFLPWLAGMATPLVAMYLAPRFLRNGAARLLFIASISLSFNAIDFSKEFKQYAVGLLLHLLLPLLAFNWMKSRATRDLIWVCASAVVGLLFSQDVMFLYPGLFLTLLIESLRGRDKRQLAIVLGGGAAAAALVLSSYFFLWSRIKKDDAEQHWGNRYNVFYLKSQQTRRGSQGPSHLAWFSDKYQAMAASPNVRRDHWSATVLDEPNLEKLREADSWLWLGLHVAGLAVLLRQRRAPELLLFWSPVLALSAANFLGRWPIGPFRTNLFLLAGMAAIASSSLEWFGQSRVRWHSLLPTCALFVAPMLLLESDYHSQKSRAYSAGVLHLLRRIERERGPLGAGKEPLYMDTQACMPFAYYTRYHPAGKRLWGQLEPRIEPICGRQSRKLMQTASRLSRGKRAWFILVNQATVPRSLRVLERTPRFNHVLLQVRKR